MIVTAFSALPDRQLEWKLVEILGQQLREEDPEKVEEWVLQQSPGYRMLYTTWILEGEVNNGGFDKFFTEEAQSRPRYLEEAKNGFALIGAKELSQITDEALQLFRKHVRFTEGLIEYTHDGVYDKLEKLDRLFFRHREGISPLRILYIRNHPEEFLLKES